MLILINNLPRTFTGTALEQLFTPFGRVDRVTLLQDWMTDRSQGRAVVEMPNDTEAPTAIAALDGISVENQVVTVQPAPARGRWRLTSLHNALLQSPPFADADPEHIWDTRTTPPVAWVCQD